MFRKTDSQTELFGPESRLDASTRRRLDSSWASSFRQSVLPILLQQEERFGSLYAQTGRPNFSVARIVGLHILQELFALDDQSALDSYSFDVRWQFALGVGEEAAYISRRSYVEFRRRLVKHDPEMQLMRGVFEQVSEAAISSLQVSVQEQRLDSTLIVSNIQQRGLEVLFRQTLEQLCDSLDDARQGMLSAPLRAYLGRDRTGWFSLGSAQERRQRLEQLADWLVEGVRRFSQDEEVNQTEAYQVAARLVAERCEVTEPDEGRGGGDGEGQGGGEEDTSEDSAGSEPASSEVKLKKKPKSPGTALQSPFDPDAGCGHKGPGYHTHVTETCNNGDKPEIITDYEVHSAGRSDRGKAIDVVNRLDGTDRKPDKLFADGGYPTADSALAIEGKGVDFRAPVDRGKMPVETMSRLHFSFDAQGHVLRCPTGHAPIDHRQTNPNGEGKALHAYFDGNQCRACDKRAQCPVRAPNNGRYGNFRLDLRPALRRRDEMFEVQQVPAWQQDYRIRSGVEATISELKRGHGLGRLRVRRLPQVRFAVACKVTACNVKRWLRAVGKKAASTRCPEEPIDASGAPCRRLTAIYGAIRDIWTAGAAVRSSNSSPVGLPRLPLLAPVAA